jgi:hypothetical protein
MQSIENILQAREEMKRISYYNKERILGHAVSPRSQICTDAGADCLRVGSASSPPQEAHTYRGKDLGPLHGYTSEGDEI